MIEAVAKMKEEAMQPYLYMSDAEALKNIGAYGFPKWMKSALERYFNGGEEDGTDRTAEPIQCKDDAGKGK